MEKEFYLKPKTISNCLIYVHASGIPGEKEIEKRVGDTSGKRRAMNI